MGLIVWEEDHKFTRRLITRYSIVTLRLGCVELQTYTLFQRQDLS